MITRDDGQAYPPRSTTATGGPLTPSGRVTVTLALCTAEPFYKVLIQIDCNKTIHSPRVGPCNRQNATIANLLGARCVLNSDGIKRAAHIASLCVNLCRARSFGSGNMKGEL